MAFDRFSRRVQGWIHFGFLAIWFCGAWTTLGLELSRSGLWFVLPAAVVLVGHLVLWAVEFEWAFSLLLLVTVGVALLEGWKFGQWLGVSLAAMLVGVAGFFLARLIFRRDVVMTQTLEHSLHRREYERLATAKTPELNAGRHFLFEGFKKNSPIIALYSSLGDAPAALLADLAGGRSPKTEISRQPKPEGEDRKENHPVDCTVFAPDRVNREQSGLLQVFLHAPEDRKKAAAEAQKFDGGTKERGHQSLVLDAPIGTQFSFEVEIDDFVFKESTGTLWWSGRPQAATFAFDVPKDCKRGPHAGSVIISKDGTPVGRISFLIEVATEKVEARPVPSGEAARHYRSCFCSYSTLDRAEMLKREQGIRAAGLETFVDAVNLRPGDVWTPKIFEAIDACDLFVIIWSQHARDSKWVRKEAHYALKRYGQHQVPHFHPIPIEGPPIAPVPRNLRAFNFNDERLLLIRAAELEAAARERRI